MGLDFRVKFIQEISIVNMKSQGQYSQISSLINLELAVAS